MQRAGLMRALRQAWFLIHPEQVKRQLEAAFAPVCPLAKG